MPQRATPPSRPQTTKSSSKQSTTRSSASNPSKLKDKRSSSDPTGPAKDASALTASTQQSILDHFETSLALGKDSTSLSALQTAIQAVKSHLYARDFAAAFGSEEFLRAYAARWSPSRSLGYTQLFLAERDTLFPGSFPEDSPSNKPHEVVSGSADDVDSLNVVCLGGGAGAELIGLAATCGIIARNRTEEQLLEVPRSKMKVHLVDSAPWGPVIESLGQKSREPLFSNVTTEQVFHQIDLLAPIKPPDGRTVERLLAQADLITIFFTLNELYATSLAATTKLLLDLGQAARPETRLCVVDSAGSYAGVTFDHGGEDGTRSGDDQMQSTQKRYPMAWMLDHTLLDLAGKGKDRQWEKMLTDEARWFRRDKLCEYPLQLEDMRYQVHAYRKI